MAEDAGSYRAVHKYARISARKARLVIDMIRGAPVENALLNLQFCQRRAAPMIRKVVRSAIANATQKAGLEAEKLVVWRAYVDEGPTTKRWRPRAMGRAFPRMRRTCHLSIELKEMAEQKAKDKAATAPAETEAEGEAAAVVSETAGGEADGGK